MRTDNDTRNPYVSRCSKQVLSKISRSTPGPGNYGVWGIPDPVVTGKATPFGKIEGGRMSTSPLRPCTHDILRVSQGVPGPVTGQI